MPELPEVETIRRQLEPALTGDRIERIEVLDPRWADGRPELIERGCSGRRIESVGRRGKYLLLELDGERFLVMHLRMTGNLLLVDGSGAEAAAHLRARISLESGRELRFVDPRRFGTGLLLAGTEALTAYLDARLGVEPFSQQFTPELLASLAAGRTAPLKSFLLAQNAIAGIGNIYADEALFRARLHPLSPAGSMKPEHARALHAGILAALAAALANGGASIDDYRDARGERGSMQDEFLVHRRFGRPCPQCASSVERIVVGGRSTYFCRSCQQRLRRRPRRRASAKAPARA